MSNGDAVAPRRATPWSNLAIHTPQPVDCPWRGRHGGTASFSQSTLRSNRSPNLARLKWTPHILPCCLRRAMLRVPILRVRRMDLWPPCRYCPPEGSPSWSNRLGPHQHSGPLGLAVRMSQEFSGCLRQVARQQYCTLPSVRRIVQSCRARLMKRTRVWMPTTWSGLPLSRSWESPQSMPTPSMRMRRPLQLDQQQ